MKTEKHCRERVAASAKMRLLETGRYFIFYRGTNVRRRNATFVTFCNDFQELDLHKTLDKFSDGGVVCHLERRRWGLGECLFLNRLRLRPCKRILEYCTWSFVYKRSAESTLVISIRGCCLYVWN